MTIAGWIGSILAPPLTRTEFEQGMKDQTEAIKAQTKVMQKNHEALIDALSEISRQLSVPSQNNAIQVNEQPPDADGPTNSGDAED